LKKLFIVDAVNFLFRAYYGIGPMTNPKGESTNALFGFIRSIYKIMADFSPDFLICVFDGPDNKKSRTDLFAEYKSHRKGMPEDLFPQLEKALQWCSLAGIPNLSIPGVEADDVIGSIAVWAEKEGIKVRICSSDKDLCQLVTNHVHLINPSKDNLEVDREKVIELFGITPEQMVDYLALVGDASDNIPGLEGFGPKTASTLLKEFGNLDTILANPDKVPGEKKQKILREGKEIAHLSRKLATIDLNIIFPKEESFFHIKYPEMEALKQFYSDMHFLSLLKELDGKTDTQKKKAERHNYQLVQTEQELETLCDILKEAQEFCLDVETTHIRPMQAEIVGIGFGTQPETAWYVPLNGPLPKEVVLEKIGQLLAHPAISIYGHNIKYDLHALLNAQLPEPRLSFDTILASYLVTPQNQRHGLDLITLERFHVAKTPIEDLIGKGKNQKSMADVPLDQITDYCCQDVDYTVRLRKPLEEELQQLNLQPVLQTIELPLVPVLVRMERRGIYVDLDKLKEMSHDLSTELRSLEKKIYQLAGEEFNINSPKQLSSVLFEKMGIPPPKKTTTGFSTSADVLEELRDRVPLANEVLHYRSLEKLRSTYVDSLPHEIHPITGRIHPTFNQSVAATGRLSCQDPNLQNIPVRSKEGKKIRTAFKPQHPGWSFLSADYSQIELRLLAHLSEDPILIKAFNEGEDIHAFTASLVFDVPLKEVTDEMRQRAKAVNFGVLYGQQAFGLSQGMGMTYKDAARFIDTYFQRYKRVKDFLEFCKESARTSGRVLTMTGRQRPIPDILSKNGALRAASERLAINTPLQGTAADLIKIAMIEIDAALLKNKLGFMLLQIHDELLFESLDDQIDMLAKDVKYRMENVLKLKVPLEVHISIGKNWGEC
jgi:DNA polymerase-1